MFKKPTTLAKYICISLCFNLGISKNVALADEASVGDKQVSKTTKVTVSKKQTTTKADTATQKDNKDSPNASADAVERDFDKIREFQSYDPATDQWSSIEHFETVEILEDTTQQREDRYIYYSFWAYDTAKERWYKVDIRDYGYRYKLGSQKPTSATAQEATLAEEELEKSKDSLWKNLGLSLSVGGGMTFYENNIDKLQLIERDGEHFLQAGNDIADNKAYRIRWFRDEYEQISNFFQRPGVYDPKTKKVVPIGKTFGFRGKSANIPVTLALHYTFFKRLRLGAGSNFEFNYLKKLSPTGDATRISDFTLKEPWLYNLKWFGLIGFKIIRKPTQAVILDVHVGRVFDIGSNLDMFWNDSGKYEHLHHDWYYSIGLGYEKKLNNYFKLMTRLSGDYKQYKDTRFSSGGTVTLYQPAVHLEVGLVFNFARDTEGNVPEVVEEEPTEGPNEPAQKLEETGSGDIQKPNDELDKSILGLSGLNNPIAR